MTTYMGIDGCKAGWVYVLLNDSSDVTIDIACSIREITNNINFDIALIDIPIGLIENGKERECDTLARSVLGNRKHSVFPVPCRSAVYSQSYDEARNINKISTSRSISKQSWNICNKIKEVDILVRDKKFPIREMHPEVCFWGLNNKNPMQFYKKTPEGEQERLNLIGKQYADIIDSFLFDNKGYLSKDDIIDAFVGAITCKLGFNKLKTLPDKPNRDAFNLLMEMVYYDKSEMLNSEEVVEASKENNLLDLLA